MTSQKDNIMNSLGAVTTNKVSSAGNEVYITSNGNEFAVTGSVLASAATPIYNTDALVALQEIDTNTDIRYLVQTSSTLRDDGKYGPPSRLVALPTKEFW